MGVKIFPKKAKRFFSMRKKAIAALYFVISIAFICLSILYVKRRWFVVTVVVFVVLSTSLFHFDNFLSLVDIRIDMRDVRIAQVIIAVARYEIVVL